MADDFEIDSDSPRRKSALSSSAPDAAMLKMVAGRHGWMMDTLTTQKSARDDTHVHEAHADVQRIAKTNQLLIADSSIYDPITFSLSIDNPLVRRIAPKFDKTDHARSLCKRIKAAMQLRGLGSDDIRSVLDIIPYYGDDVVVTASIAEYFRALTYFSNQNRLYVFVRNTFAEEWRDYARSLSMIKTYLKKGRQFKVITLDVAPPIPEATLPEVPETEVKPKQTTPAKTGKIRPRFGGAFAEKTMQFLARAREEISSKEAKAKEARAKAHAKSSRLGDAEDVAPSLSRTHDSKAPSGRAKRKPKGESASRRIRKDELESKLIRFAELDAEGDSNTGRRGDVSKIIGLELLRVIEPGVYEALARARLNLPQDEEIKGGQYSEELVAISIASEEEDDMSPAEGESIIGRSSARNLEAVRYLIRELYPGYFSSSQLAWYREQPLDGQFQELRAKYPNRFYSDFDITPPAKGIRPGDIVALLKSIRNNRSLSRALEGFYKKKCLVPTLDWLHSVYKRVDPRFGPPLVAGLMDASEFFVMDRLHQRLTPPHVRAGEMIFALLRSMHETEEREKLLIATYQTTNGFFLPYAIAAQLHMDGKRSAEEGAEHLVGASTARRLLDTMSERLRARARDGSLAEHPMLYPILGIWSQTENPEEAKMWTRELSETTHGAITIATRFFHYDDRSTKFQSVIDLAKFEPFIELNVLSRKLSSVKIGDLQEDRKRAVRAFQRAYRKFRENGQKEFWINEKDLI